MEILSFPFPTGQWTFKENYLCYICYRYKKKTLIFSQQIYFWTALTVSFKSRRKMQHLFSVKRK